MKADQLLQDLQPSSRYCAETVAALRQAGITTYNQLFALLRDETADVELRAKAAWALSWLHKTVDKRRVVPHLLVALESTDEEVRRAAIHALGMLESRRAVKPLIEFASDRNQPQMVRVDSIIALCQFNDQPIADFLRKVAFDQDEDLYVCSQ